MVPVKQVPSTACVQLITLNSTCTGWPASQPAVTVPLSTASPVLLSSEPAMSAVNDRDGLFAMIS